MRNDAIVGIAIFCALASLPNIEQAGAARETAMLYRDSGLVRGESEPLLRIWVWNELHLVRQHPDYRWSRLGQMCYWIRQCTINEMRLHGLPHPVPIIWR